MKQGILKPIKKILIIEAAIKVKPDLMVERWLGSRDLGRKTEEGNLEALALNPINPKGIKVNLLLALLLLGH